MMSTTPTPQNHPTGRKRLVHQLDTPFSTTSWPEISPDDQDAILELLCSFLRPLGQHRRALAPSKGKRAAKRAKATSTSQLAPSDTPHPPGPDVASSIDVGFNSISRGLQASPTEPYSMVFVTRGNTSSAFHCHFPQMVGSAPGDPIRLVGFSRACSDRLASALGVPRASSVAVKKKAPGAQALLAFVEQKVAPVRMPWVESGVEYRSVRIRATETTVGAKRVRHG